jgi:hypothetical protein
LRSTAGWQPAAVPGISLMRSPQQAASLLYYAKLAN